MIADKQQVCDRQNSKLHIFFSLFSKKKCATSICYPLVTPAVCITPVRTPAGPADLAVQFVIGQNLIVHTEHHNSVEYLVLPHVSLLKMIRSQKPFVKSARGTAQRSSWSDLTEHINMQPGLTRDGPWLSQYKLMLRALSIQG